MEKEEKIALIRENAEKMIKLIEEDKHVEVELKPISDVYRDDHGGLVTKKVGEAFSIIYKK